MQKTITKDGLTEEIKAAMEDVFVAKINVTDGKIEMQFVNGQSFVLTVEEK